MTWDGSSFALSLDGSGIGIDRSLDVDAVHDFGNGEIAISFDTDATVGSFSLDDAEFAVYDVNVGAWIAKFDRTFFLSSAWGETDLDALYLPEPSGGIALAVGVCGVAALTRRRSLRSSVGLRPARRECLALDAGATRCPLVCPPFLWLPFPAAALGPSTSLASVSSEGSPGSTARRSATEWRSANRSRT